MVPTKFVSVFQLVRLVETWMWPFNPVDNCRLKTSPFVFSGKALVNASCSLKVLLETTLTLLVIEKFPPRSTAYAFKLLVPATNSTVAVQFVQPFAVAGSFQVPLLS